MIPTTESTRQITGSIFTLIITSKGEATENAVTEVEQSPQTNSSMPSILEATASKLVRYRSNPPVNYYRYKTQPFKRPRPRIKAPKTKYGPPIYSEPSSYYKQPQNTYTSTQSFKPSFSYNDEAHYEVSSEYPVIENIPISGYETHVELYEDSYPKKKAPPRYEFSKPQKSNSGQRPHKVYGVPKQPSFNSYDSYSGDDHKSQQYASQPEVHYDVSYHEEPQNDNYGLPAPQKEKYEEFPPYGAPPKEYVSYQVPDNKYEAPVNSYHPQEHPSPGGPYPAYDKKLPNAGYSNDNHFAEPPTDVHITYSPSYEINPLPPKHRPPQNNFEAHPSDNYGPPTDNYGPPSDNYGPPSDNYGPSNDNYGPPSGNYGPPSDNNGPPDYNQKPNNNYQAPSDSYHQSSGGNFAEPPGSYLPPVHHQDDLPLKTNHMPPGYDYPKSSYEVPLYDPIPFESTTPEQDYFPPNHNTREPQHEHASESNNQIHRIVPSHAPNPTSTTSSSSTDHEPVQQANIKVNRFSPPNHRRKHFHRHDSTSKSPVEIEQPNSSESPSSKYLDKILSTTTSTFRPRRKRKRTKAPVTEKHNLDTPELQEAFESGSDQADEQTAHASDIKENVDPVRQPIRTTSPVKILTEFSPSQSWNPMRIRNKQTNAQRGQRTAADPLNDLKNVEILSIEKSHSQSYYAGTVPPRTRKLSSRADAVKLSTIPSTTFKAEDALQTTKNFVLDKTYFKAKDDKEDYYDGTGELPKNHKPF